MSKKTEFTTDLNNVLKHGIIPELGKPYRGKVRDCYSLGDKLLFITSDRISAFDVIMGRGVPLKGQVLNQLACYWFEQTKDIIPNHIIDIPDPSCMLVKSCKPFKVETVVRRFVTGSAWRSYQEKGGLCGITLPKGLKKDARLEDIILTPSTKAHSGHDEEISRSEIIRKKLVPEKIYSKIKF